MQSTYSSGHELWTDYLCSGFIATECNYHDRLFDPTIRLMIRSYALITPKHGSVLEYVTMMGQTHTRIEIPHTNQPNGLQFVDCTVLELGKSVKLRFEFEALKEPSYIIISAKVIDDKYGTMGWIMPTLFSYWYSGQLSPDEPYHCLSYQTARLWRNNQHSYEDITVNHHCVNTRATNNPWHVMIHLALSQTNYEQWLQSILNKPDPQRIDCSHSRTTLCEEWLKHKHVWLDGFMTAFVLLTLIIIAFFSLQ
eukprot:247009_1